MTAYTSKVVQVHVESLGSFYKNLGAVLGETGFSGSRLNEILSTSVRAQCVRCGIVVAGDEIEQMAVTGDYQQLPHPKLQRLRLGYCARDGCDSYYYDLHLDSHEELDWEAVAAKALNLTNAQKAVAAQTNKRQKNRQRRLRVMRLALVFLIGIVLLLSWFMVQHHGLPFARQHQKYQVDPASAESGVAK